MLVGTEYIHESARLSLQSSELAPPAPLRASESCPPPVVPGGDTHACGWGGGGVPIPTTGENLSALPTLWGHSTPIQPVSSTLAEKWIVNIRYLHDTLYLKFDVRCTCKYCSRIKICLHQISLLLFALIRVTLPWKKGYR